MDGAGRDSSDGINGDLLDGVGEKGPLPWNQNTAKGQPCRRPEQRHSK